MKGFKKGKAATSDINVTPLIDVVLVLLIIFMVITPITIEEMAVNLPKKTESVQKEDVPKDQLVAAACKDGSFALNKRIMSLDELATQARKRLRRKKEKVVFIDGHPNAGYRGVVQLIDTVREAGAERVGIASLKDAEEFSACSASAAATTPAEGATEGAPDGAAP